MALRNCGGNEQNLPYCIYTKRVKYRHNNKQIMEQQIRDFLSQISPDADMDCLLTHKQLITELQFCHTEHPKKMASNIDSLVSIVSNYQLTLSNQYKYEYMEIIVEAMEIYPTFLKKNVNRIQSIYTLLCQIMANVKDEVNELWLHPPKGFVEDDYDEIQKYDSDTAMIDRLRGLMDRLSSIVGFREMVSIIELQAINFYKDGDWRWKNAVLMTLSQLSEDYFDKIGNLMVIVKQGMNDPHPKVRYAAVQVLGQFSDDMKPEFQDRYFSELMPMIINGFNDPIERVASHWLACFTNFIEEYSNTAQIAPFTNQIIQKICQFIENASQTSKQNAISSLSSLVTVPCLFDKTTIQRPFQICHSIMQVFSPQTHKQLISQTFQCISITIQSQPNILINKYIGFILDIINQIGRKIDTDYLIAGWHRLCNCEVVFQNWQTSFAIVWDAIKNGSANSLRIGLNAIVATSNCFKQQFFPFSKQILTQVHSRLSNNTDEDQQIQIGILDAIQQILSKSKPTNPDPSWQQMVKTYMMDYIQKSRQTLNSEGGYRIVQKLLDSIKELLSGYNYLFVHQLGDIYQFCIQIVKKIDLLKINVVDGVGEYQDQDADQDLMEEKKQQDMENLNKCKLCIPDIMREILKNFNQPEHLIPEILSHVSNSIITAVDGKDMQYAIFYMDNLLEDFSYETLQPYWSQIYQNMKKYCSNPDALLRNSAVFGLGILTEKTPFEIVNYQNIMTWTQDIKQAYLIPRRTEETKKIYGHCQDNCVASIGKILKRYHGKYNLKFLHAQWLQILPLKYDQEQNRIQMEYLYEIIEKNPGIIFENSPDDVGRLKRVLKIMGELTCHYRKKKLNLEKAKILNGCKKAVMLMSKWTLFTQNQKEIIDCLSKTEQMQLIDLVTNPEVLADFKL